MATESQLKNNGYFQVTAVTPGAAVTAAERGRAKITSRRRKPRTQHERRRRPNGTQTAAIARERLQELLALLGRLHERLLSGGRDINFTLVAVPGGYQLRAYDCGTNRQVCRLIHERLIHSPEHLEQLILETINGTGVLLNVNG
jgi:hypothetical protein